MFESFMRFLQLGKYKYKLMDTIVALAVATLF